MSGTKRDWSGNAKRRDGPRGPQKPVVKNAYTPMFEALRDELDAHHDRRERLVKASRDVTALSKKIIFSLQRVRKIERELPSNIQAEVDSRLAEIAKLLAAMAPEIQGINRYRYARSLMCLEELAEALTFSHYLRTQTLLGPDELASLVDDLVRRGAAPEDAVMADAGDTAGADTSAPPAPPAPTESPTESPTVALTLDDYIYGVFDLTGEMMRFATTSTALTGTLAGGASDGSADEAGDEPPRTILHDMHELGTFFEMLPVPPGNRVQWEKKLAVTRQSVRKVERLGYDRIVRGSERPKGWVPDLDAEDQAPGEEE
ncbi:hypothetical protein VTJ83DRAFT_3056 [Remersonia thermophila]|uniref:Translin-associated protein X n=1 Tax=Remersonia thermophila TaxID=72144 RepID=A0ABR4DD14_9PEZI